MARTISAPARASLPPSRKRLTQSRAAFPAAAAWRPARSSTRDTGFVGAATIAQVRLFNQHPTGKALKHERLQALMGDGGIQECGFAQNCVEVCPKDIPLTKAIADTGREVMKQAIKDFFRG